MEGNFSKGFVEEVTVMFKGIMKVRGQTSGKTSLLGESTQKQTFNGPKGDIVSSKVGSSEAGNEFSF